MYLSDGANFNLTEHLPKDFTNLDDQILLMVDTMTGMWQAKPGSLISNVVCQSGNITAQTFHERNTLLALPSTRSKTKLGL